MNHPALAFTEAAADLRGLPINLEAEQAVLGAILYDNIAIERVEDLLQPADFHEPFHQRLYGAILEMTRTGRLAEPIALMERFKRDQAFEDFGGLMFLANLVDRAPPALQAADFARIVHDLAVRREMIRVGQQMIADAQDANDTDADLLVEKAEGALYAMAEQGDAQGAGLVSFSEAVSSTLEAISTAFQRDASTAGLLTGLADLDRKLGGLHQSDLLILAGRPSMGKTALATNIAFRVARSYEEVATQDGRMLRTRGGKVAFYSLEMSKEQLTQRILSEVSGISSDKMRRGDIDAAQFGQLRELAGELASIPLHIDETGGLTISKLRARAKRLQRRHGLHLIVVDYLQLVAGSKGRSDNRVGEVTEITQGLKALAKDLKVPVIALAQLSRKVEERDDKRPQLSDLRESGSIEQDADVVMFVYRDEYYLSRSEPKAGSSAYGEWEIEMESARGKADVIIGKQRHGPIGTVPMAFDANTTRFSDLARDNTPSARSYGYRDD